MGNGEVTYEDASRCPQCMQPGKVQKKQKLPRHAPGGGEVHVFVCENERCPDRFEETGSTWLVQVQDDGTIPIRQTGPKQFESMLPGHQAAARRQLEQVIIEDALARGADPEASVLEARARGIIR